MIPEIHAYLKLSYWPDFLENLFGLRITKFQAETIINKYRCTIPATMIVYYSYGDFVIGICHKDDRYKPVFHIYYKKNYYSYRLDFKNIEIFKSFLTSIKKPEELPLYITFPYLSDLISDAIKDLC